MQFYGPVFLDLQVASVFWNQSTLWFCEKEF
jgi:hypothetical protein